MLNFLPTQTQAHFNLKEILHMLYFILAQTQAHNNIVGLKRSSACWIHSITNTSWLQAKGNKTHAKFLLAQATIFPTVTFHRKINLVHERFPSSPKISTLPITTLLGEINLMCFRFPSCINTRRQKRCNVKEL